MTESRLRAARSVLISIGSNIEPERNLVAAVEILDAESDLRRVSRVFATRPVGDKPMPAFLNAAVELRTRSGPRELRRSVLRRIEHRLGRVRGEDRNAPRTIDLDIAVFGDLVLEEVDLTLPDPEILTRAHVAVPLADVAPEMRHPVDGRRLGEIGAALDDPDAVRPAPDAEALRVACPHVGLRRERSRGATGEGR